MNDIFHGAQLLSSFHPDLKPDFDDQLPDDQMPASIQLHEVKDKTPRQTRFTSTPAILHDHEDLSTTETTAALQHNTSGLYTSPQPSITNIISTSLASREGEVVESVSSPLEPRSVLQPPQEPSVTWPSQSLDALLPDTQESTDQAALSLDNGPGSFISTSKASKNTPADSKLPLNKISCKERKRIIVSPTRPPNVTKAMIDWVRKTNWLLDPFREDDDCWLHPSPPSALLSVSGASRPVGKLQKRFTWKDKEGKHSVVLNYGIVVKLVNYQMTKQQQDGFVNKQWHLSHLCGNWTCLNPAHTTVEPGHVNISRNNCFSHRSGCLHTPKCLKDKKVALGADGKLVDHSEQAARGSQEVDQRDDWSSPLLVDDNDSMMDDYDDSESIVTEDMDATDSASANPEIDTCAGIAEPGSCVPTNNSA